MLYFGQALIHIQFADLLQGSDRVKSAVVGAVSGLMFGTAAGAILLGRLRSVKVPKDVIPGIVIFFIGSVSLPFVALRDSRNWTLMFVGTILGVAVPMSVLLFAPLKKGKQKA